MFSRTRLLVLLLAAAFALLGRLALPGLRAEEPRRAVVAMEMVFTGEWIVPHVGGWNYYNKPPLFNWVLGGLFSLFGSFSEVLVRLPGIAALFATAWGVYRVGRRYVGESAAQLAAFALLACGDMLLYATVYAGEIDLFHMGLVFAQAALIFLFFEKKQYLALFVGSYALAAVGVLTKGLPSLLTQACTLLALFAWHRRFLVLFYWQHMVGMAVFFLLCGAYFYAYSLRSDLLPFAINLVKESSQKSAAEASLWRIVPHLFVFPAQLFKIVLPWGFMALFLLRRGVREAIGANPLLRYSVLFVGANVLVYWISPQTRDRYLYQFMPFLLLILAWGYTSGSALMPRAARVWTVVSGFLASLLPLLFAGLPLVRALWDDMQAPWLVTSVFSVVAAGVAWGFWREPAQRAFWLLLALFVLRAGYNYAVLPHHDQAFGPAEYRAHCDTILTLSGGAPVYYTGHTSEQDVHLKLPLLPETGTRLYLPTHMHHQFHYYLGRRTGGVFRFDARPVSGRYYLAKEDELPHLGVTPTPLYRFKISYAREWLVFFRMP